MTPKAKKALERIRGEIAKACDDLDRHDYMELLRDIGSDCETKLDALGEDEEEES